MDSSSQVFVTTPHGRFEINNWQENNTIFEVCQLNRIPPSAVSFYIQEAGRLSLVTNVLAKIKDAVPPGSSLVIRPDRNINYHEVIPEELLTDVGADDVSEYFFPNDSRSHILKGLDSEECKAFVYERVHAASQEHISPAKNAPLVVGVSGGGDSNVLVGSLLAAGFSNIHPVMMMGIPDWDKGRSRAQEICDSHGVPLRVLESDEVGRLLGVVSGRNWVQAFEEVYPDVDLEMLGTLAIRLALTAVAKEVGAKVVVTGLNLEDLLGEAIMCVLEGQPPLPFPIRSVGDVDIFYPLYKCPKKIIDGCFPKYSLANYEDRFPSRLRGRALAYYLAQSMNGLIPGIEFDLLEGFAKIARNWESMHFDPELGFTVLRSISPEARARWKSFLGQ
ncbi:hypothetical protein ACFWZ4_12955 [Frateuria sp. GZRe12]|uniref:hypothetical protein n=1 Tax=Frateuria sp. GZRe12 TaxID=3351533 RepID=UPI003EDC9032